MGSWPASASRDTANWYCIIIANIMAMVRGVCRSLYLNNFEMIEIVCDKLTKWPPASSIHGIVDEIWEISYSKILFMKASYYSFEDDMFQEGRLMNCYKCCQISGLVFYCFLCSNCHKEFRCEHDKHFKISHFKEGFLVYM